MYSTLWLSTLCFITVSVLLCILLCVFPRCILLQFLCSYIFYPVAFHNVFYYSYCSPTYSTLRLSTLCFITVSVLLCILPCYFQHCILLQFLCSYEFYPVVFHIVFYYSFCAPMYSTLWLSTLYFITVSVFLCILPCGFPHCVLLQFLCSYVFYPVAFLMGVAEDDCFEVATLIGDKTFINEFYAYTRLSVFIKNRENLTWYGHGKLTFERSLAQ